jgi:asparagine synthase (glutamine-hydrolysing)
VARHLGTIHHELILDSEMLSDLVPTITAQLDEPMADASIVPTYLLSRFAREHVKVALGGDGGDELLAGYPTLQAHRLAGYYRRLPGFASRSLVPALVKRLPVSMNNISLDFKAKRFVDGAMHPVGPRHARWMGAFTPESRERLLSDAVRAEVARAQVPDVVSTHLASQAALKDPIDQVLYLDMKMYLENDILVKLDRASMMASLEARVPLLNKDFVEFATGLPLRLKLNRLQGKHLLRYALRPLLPAQILRRGKKGFGIPIGKWFRGPLRSALLEALDRDRIERDGFFSYGAVRELLDAHLSGRRDCRKELWSLYVFQRWCETYLNAPSGAVASTVPR